MRILVVDDEENIRKSLGTFLRLSGHEVTAVAGIGEAKEALAGRGGEAFTAAVVDVYVGEERGSELLDFAAGRGLRTTFVMMSGQGRVRDAVEAVRKGAWDFLEKPLDTERLLALLRNIEREAGAARRLEGLEGAWLEEHLHAPPGSPLVEALALARRAAASPLSVLVEGPTGSGKELVARWIHLCSPRSRGPFVAVNCAAVPHELAESSFFGSKRGSFTGADADRQGWFAAAAGGSLFLDEVGELGPAVQAKLLRAVETGEIQPVGASSPVTVDVRLVAATNRDLEAEAAAGRFRADLFWRLAQVRIALPSLAERRGDIRGLVAFFAAPLKARMGEGAPRLGEEALAWLEARPWPGNVRELRGFVERALWLAAPGSEVGAAFLAGLGGEGARPGASPAAPAADGGSPAAARPVVARGFQPLAAAKEGFEKAYVEAALAEAGGSVGGAARLLGLLPNNLSRKLRELGIK